MATYRLPLFPLQVVLLPGQRLPLHIFEERYKLMIGECVEKGAPFGIVLVEKSGVHKIGCAAPRHPGDRKIPRRQTEHSDPG